MSKRIGYARVSTDDQNLDLQRDALTRSGCVTIYEETASGKSSIRIELEHCQKALRAGDTLVVWRLDRLGRSLSDLVKIISDLEREGITFESLGEKIDTAVACAAWRGCAKAPGSGCKSRCLSANWTWPGLKPWSVSFWQKSTPAWTACGCTAFPAHAGLR